MKTWTVSTSELAPSTETPRPPQSVLRDLALTALAYFSLCTLGGWMDLFPHAGGYASFWPAAAIPLVAALWRGPWVLPGIVLGRLVFDLLPAAWVGPQALGMGWHSLLTAVLAAVQGWLGARAIQRHKLWPVQFIQPVATLAFLGWAALSVLPLGTWRFAWTDAALHAGPLELAWGWLNAVAGDLLGVLWMTPLMVGLRLGDREAHRVRRLGGVFAVGYLVSACCAGWLLRLEQEQLAQRWQSIQAQAQQALGKALHNQELALGSLATTLQNSPAIDRRSFAHSATPLLDLVQGLGAMAWSPSVLEADRQSFERRLTDQYPGVGAIRHRRGDQWEVADHRAHYLPIAAIEAQEPLDHHVSAPGLDAYSEPAYQSAIERALRSGQPATTQRLPTLQGPEAAYEVVIFWPVSAPASASATTRAPALRGFVTADVHLQRLAAQTILALHSPGATAATQLGALGFGEAASVSPDSVAYRLLDLNAPEGEQDIWSHPSDASHADDLRVGAARWITHAVAVPPQSVDLRLGDRHYRLVSYPRASFWSDNPSQRPTLVFSFGLWMTLGVAVIFLLLTGYQRALAEQVEERTVDLRQAQYSLTDAMLHAQAKSDQLGFLLQQTPVGFLAFDEQGQLRLGNQAPLEMLGLSSLQDIPDLPGLIQHLTQKLPDVSPHQLLALGQPWSSPDTAAASLNRVRLIDSCGRWRHVTLSLLKFPQGPVRHLFTLVDMSADVALETSKSEFISLMAHEIRTPLTSILGYADLLHARPELPSQERVLMASTVVAKARQIQALLGKMLSLSELEIGGATALRTERQDLCTWLPKTVQAFRVPVGRQAPDCVIHVPEASVVIDARKLERALGELLSNAYAFSAATDGVQVRLSAATSPSHTPELHIEVLDPGIGMSPEQIAQAGVKFYRVEKSGEKPGFGLGLALAKLIIELHRGRLDLHPRDGQPGLCATLVLPMRTGPDRPPA